jgi:hypothetical protein
VTTARRRAELRPLEQLQIREVGSFVSVPLPLEAEPEGTKSRFVSQLEAFLALVAGGVPDARLCPVAEAVSRLLLAERIFGYID